MDNKQKEILKKFIEYPKGLISQGAFLTAIAEKDTKSAHALISAGFIEEVTRRVVETGQDATFYRSTPKGRNVFAPWYVQAWFLIKGDLRTVIVACIISVITTLITAYLSR